MSIKKIATHEAFELHELLTFKNICATKSAVMSKLVTDQELKELMEIDYMDGRKHIHELQELIRLSTLYMPDPPMNQIEVSDQAHH